VKRSAVLFAAGLVWSGSARLAAQSNLLWHLDIITDVTDAGHKLAPPKPGSRVCYLPQVVGFQQLGEPLPGETAPPPDETTNTLARALAGQGYWPTHLVASKSGGPGTLSPPPSLILVFYWGSLRQSEKGSFTHDQSFGLVMGQTAANMPPTSAITPSTQADDPNQAVNDDRYFIAIMAYDFNAYMQSRKQVLLWTTKTSIRANGLTLAQVVPALAAGSGPYFGRETKTPKMLDVPAAPAAGPKGSG
jgi:hypothetical protein